MVVFDWAVTVAITAIMLIAILGVLLFVAVAVVDVAAAVQGWLRAHHGPPHSSALR